MSLFKNDKSSPSNGKLKYIIFAIIFVAGLVYLIFNESGVIKYLKLKEQVKSLNEQVSDVDKDNKRLQSEIDSLNNKVPAKIERTAREKYGMIRKGEKTIKINEK
jgi:cell division protein FtsB